MKTLPRLLSVFVLLAGLTAGLPAAPTKATAPVDRFDRTKAEIDALLGPRLKPAPLPAKYANPFQVTAANSATETSAGPSTPDPGPPVSVPEPTTALSGDDEILARYASALKISGVVQIGDMAHLVINQTPYREGSSIPVRTKDDTTIYIKVLHITPTELVLGYNDAELTVTLKK